MAPRKMLKMSHQKNRVPMRRSMLLRLGHLPSHSAHLMPNSPLMSACCAELQVPADPHEQQTHTKLGRRARWTVAGEVCERK